jgi:hypothetical protein
VFHAVSLADSMGNFPRDSSILAIFLLSEFFSQLLSPSGWWYTYPSEKYESQLRLLFPIYGKIKNVPNHQPDYILLFQLLTIINHRLTID